MSTTTIEMAVAEPAADFENTEKVEEDGQELSYDDNDKKQTRGHFALVSVESQKMDLEETCTSNSPPLDSMLCSEGEEEDSIDKLMDNNTIEQNLTIITNGIFSRNEQEEYFACKLARKMMTGDVQKIEPLIKSGIVPKFIALLKSPSVDIKYEATWIMVCLACQNSSQTNYMVGNGAIEPLIEFLNSTQDADEGVVENAIWALGNIAADGPILRDMLINKGVIPLLLALIKPGGTPQPLNLACTLSILFESKQVAPTIEIFREVLPPLVNLIMSDDIETLRYACMILEELTVEPTNEKIEELLKADDALPHLIQLLNSNEQDLVVAPALLIICRALAGDVTQSERVLESGPLIEHLEKFLQSPNLTIASRAAWAIANISAVIHRMNELFSRNLIAPLLQFSHNKDNTSTQYYAIHCAKNITIGGTLEQLADLRQNGVIPAICATLQSECLNNVTIAMDCLRHMLRRANESGQLQEILVGLEECGVPGILESLKNHEHEDVCMEANILVVRYFNDEEEIEVDLMENFN